VIRSATADDAGTIAGIYNYYILNTVVTFEEQAVTADEIAGRIVKVALAQLPYQVLVHDGRVVAYAYAGKWHERSAYRYSVETTVYVDHDCIGKGLGATLYKDLLQRLKERGVHTAIGGIALPNPGSIALHQALGFSKAAHYAEVGFKFNAWVAVEYWQLFLRALQ
jgi:phosphinothricin acetyltransferase